MSADRFEARVTDWLEDGPVTAPRGIETASLAHARTHPRSRRAALRRQVAPHDRALAAASLTLVAAFAVLIVGMPRIGGGGDGGPEALVGGTETCEIRVPGVEVSTTEQGQMRLEGRITACREEASDPRVSGSLTRRVTADLFDPDADYPAGTSNHYGAAELRSDAGAWTGAFVATYLGRTAPDPEGRLSWIGLGTGALEGLVYRATVVTDASKVSTISGTIEPVGPDAAIASLWCFVTSPSPADSNFEPVKGTREFTRTCTVASDDPRLAGTAVEHRSITIADDGSASDRGSIELTTAGGSWRGTFAGTGDWYVPGQITGTLEGVDGLIGSRMQFRVVSEDGMHGVLVGEFARDR